MTRIIEIQQRHGRHGYGHGQPRKTVFVRDTNERFLTAVIGDHKRVAYSSSTNLARATNVEHLYGAPRDRIAFSVPTTSLAVQAMHQAFAGHVAFSLTPDIVWYMIISAVAEHIRQNSARYAGLFTDQPDQAKSIDVRDDSLRYDASSAWRHAIPLFREGLRANLGDDKTELFLPFFSTTTEEDEIAALIAFMDAASPYYKYTLHTMCHIPQINLAGEHADWIKIHDRAVQLCTMFGGLEAFFTDLRPVLARIAAAANGEDDEHFWQSMYKYREESNGDRVTGWINAFFAHIQTANGPVPKSRFDWQSEVGRLGGGVTTDQLPSHISQVPFVWNYLGQRLPMALVAGITSVGLLHDRYLEPRLGYAVIEH